MLLALFTYRLILDLLVALAIVCCIVLVVRKIRALKADEIAPARLGETPFVLRVAPVLILIATLGAIWQMLDRATDVIVVFPGPVAQREIYLGSPDHYRAMPRRDQGDVGVPPDPTWIVNKSDRTLSIVTVHYEMLSPDPLGPRELGVAPSIEHIGPDDRPPAPRDRHSSIFGPGHEENCTWLTW